MHEWLYQGHKVTRKIPKENQIAEWSAGLPVVDSRGPPAQALRGTWSYLLGQLPPGRQWALSMRTLSETKAQGPVSAVYQLTAMACSGLSHRDKHGARKPGGHIQGQLSHWVMAHWLPLPLASSPVSRSWSGFQGMSFLPQVILIPATMHLPLSSTGSAQPPGILLLTTLTFFF